MLAAEGVGRGGVMVLVEVALLRNFALLLDPLQKSLIALLALKRVLKLVLQL